MKKISVSIRDIFWKEDPLGFFTIRPFVKEGVIRVRYYQNHQLKYIFSGQTPEQLYHKIGSMGLISRFEHAAYLGKELEKAHLAMQYQLSYIQDEPLVLEKKALKKRERRIVSLAPSNTEILYALGRGKNIIATTRFCDYPPDAKKKTKIGGWLDIDLLQVKKMNADLVLTSTSVQEKIVQEARRLNLNLVHVDPRRLQEIYDSILTLGELTEKHLAAEKLVEDMEKKIENISRKALPGKKPRVYIEEWHKPPTGSGNWVPELVALAGGKYELISPGKLSKMVTTAEVKNYNPEIIILSLCGFGKKVNVEIITKREGWEQLNAVRTKRVYAIDDSLLNRPGPRLVQGLQFLVEKINLYKRGKK